MITPLETLQDLATVVLLFRDQPDQKETQRAAFKHFVANLPDTDHVLRVVANGFVWDQIEVPVGRSEVSALHDHLRAHGIGEIRLPIGLMTSTLLSLIRVIAAPPGTYGSFDHLAARLDAAGCGIIPVLPLPDSIQAPPVYTAIPIIPQQTRPPTPPTPIPGKVDDDGRLNAIGPDALTEAKVGIMHFVTMQTKAIGPADELIQNLAAAQSDKAISDSLNQLVAACEEAARNADWREVLAAANGLVQLEGRTGDHKAGEHRAFGIALRRLLPRSVLEQIARFTAHGNQKAEALAVVKRMGADGTEVLLHLLTNSEDMNERRSYFNALKEMTEGGELLVHMLSHDQWFVVRNVAELCGELHLESAVPALTKQAGHSDERVRRAVIGALGRIASSHAIEPLRRALRDSSPAVRMEVARSVDSKHNRNLAMSLAVAADEESVTDVQQEMLLALGRIGSPDALQALIKAAEPGGKVFRRKPVALRLAAVAGLHAAGPSAANPLKDLLQDDDREVRDAVQKALATLWD
jgi:HEAT repeat protein